MLERLRRQLAEKRAKIQERMDACDAENRDLTPDEQTAMDALLEDVASLKDRVDKLEAMQADVDAEADPARSRTRGIGRRSTPIGPGHGPAIHTGERQTFSYLRAFRSIAENGRLDGLEAEVSQEIARRTSRRPKGFFGPVGSDPEIRHLAFGSPRNGGRPERRDLTTTTGAGGLFNIMEAPLIELLRSKLVIHRMGATMLNDMQGLFSIPRQDTTATVYWLSEGNAATLSALTLDQVAFVPKIGIAATNYTRDFLNQTSLDAELLVKNDLAAKMATEFDRVAINGSGGSQPLGILQNSTIQTNSSGIAIGPSGGPFTFATSVNMESQIAIANAEMGKLAYLMGPALRGELKQLPKVGSTYPVFVYEDGPEPDVGKVNGYPSYVTTNCPANITKGSGSNLKAAIFGNWADLVCSTWEGVDFIVNPFTNQLNGGVIISMSLAMDVEVRHPESFSIILDAA